MNRIDIAFEESEAPWRSRAEAFTGTVLEKLDRHNWDLSVFFCSNAYIRSLNARYRKTDEATDVLSFTLGESSGGRWLPGDIVISLDMVRENARVFAVPPDEELRRLLIHGILHLEGMDHGSNDRDEPMLILQEELLEECSGLHILDEETERRENTECGEHCEAV